MINGTPSKVIYFGAFALLALCVTGILVLAFNDKKAPDEVSFLMTALVSFILGSHVKAPTSQDREIKQLDSRMDRQERR